MRSNERGVALLITLLVVSLLTVIVIEFTHSTEVDAHLTRNSLASTQAYYLARSGLQLAEMTLLLDAEQKSKTPPERAKAETPGDTWAQPFPPMPVGDAFGTAGFTIVDESGRFNLNALTGNPQSPEGVMRQQMFQGILETVGLDPNLLYPVMDWLDPGDETDRESGAESPYYLGLRPPYVPRNGRMLRMEELLLVKEFDQLTYEQWTVLRDVLTVLPNDELRININTASELLLKGLFEALGGPSAATTILEQRADHSFTEEKELQELLRNYIPPMAAGKFGIRSQYFTIYATGSAGDVERHLAVTEQRPPNVFPARLTLVDWREEPKPVSLTSLEASGGMISTLP